jgi:hypothetical protein
MENSELNTALCDLVDAIRSITLGSIESVVIRDAGISMIQSWNDHNEDKIDEGAELANWEHLCLQDLQKN